MARPDPPYPPMCLHGEASGAWGVGGSYQEDSPASWPRLNVPLPEASARRGKEAALVCMVAQLPLHVRMYAGAAGIPGAAPAPIPKGRNADVNVAGLRVSEVLLMRSGFG
jgi:hypothetical protein